MSYCIAQGTLLSGMWQPGWEGSLGENRYMHIYMIRPANLENSERATGLEKVSFHFNPKERQSQTMFELLHKCTHFTR